jgi:acyl dehydratase
LRARSIRSPSTSIGTPRSSVSFGRLAASGWHTGAMTMRLLVDSEFRIAGGIVCTGFDEFRCKCLVYPVDVLHLETEVVEVRPSKSNPDRGLVKVRITTLNQKWSLFRFFWRASSSRADHETPR